MFSDEGITGDYIHPDMRKIITQGSWLIAACGEDRICDVVQYVVKYPVVPNYLINKPINEWYAWMATQVVPRIAAAIEKTMPKAYKNSIGDSELLLVTHGKAFLIGDTLGVTKAVPYWSVGSGSPIALGYLASVSQNKAWEEKHANHAEQAVLMAQKHDPYTRGAVTGFYSYPNGSVENA
jgi:hypothetical protein